MGRISSKKELMFYLMADRMMNRGTFTASLKEKIKRIFLPDNIMRYLVSYRYCDYYSQVGGANPFYLYHLLRYHKLGQKLGFTIGKHSLGYGVVIPHYGTIVIGPSNRIGNFAVLHTSICITDHQSQMGDAFYCSTGARIVSKLTIGDNVTIGANSVVTKTNEINNNVVIAGIPAKVIKETKAWYERDGIEYKRRYESVMNLKESMGL